MAKGVNKVIILGRLGGDPEVKTIASGTAVCNFTVATSETFNNSSGEKQEKTEWHRVVAWGKLAEICGKYLRKGSQVYVEGKLQTRNWEDPKSGEKRYSTEILISEMQMLDSAPAGDRAPSAYAQQPRPQTTPSPTGTLPTAPREPSYLDDLPF